MVILLPQNIYVEKYGSSLNLVAQNERFGYSYIFGTLGDTECCGSACVVVTEIDTKIFFDILRTTQASVLHIVESATWIIRGLPEYEKKINDTLGDAAHIEIFPQREGWLVLVHIDDEDLYSENFL